MSSEWGPLAALIGSWEGDQGLDVAFSHSRGTIFETPYKEVATFKPFGPVENGSQTLYGLDYKTAMWRDSEENPFHTEVGYWLWDAAGQQVLRCFVVPRGITVLAGGRAEPDATSFTMTAESGSPGYSIASNQYLLTAARTIHYETTFTVVSDGVISYTEDTVLLMKEFTEPFHHTDRNVLRRVG
jgi:hypothetical protein